MTENVEVAVVRSDLEELVFWPIPLIEDFLHKILVLVQLKPQRSFVRLATGVALNVQAHGQSVS